MQKESTCIVPIYKNYLRLQQKIKLLIMQQKFFYGWIIIIALFVMYTASNGIALNTFNLYTKEFTTAFGVDMDKALRLASVLYLALALPLPFIGRLLEKVSAKKLVLFGAIGTVASLFLFAFARSYNMVMLFVIVYPLFLAVTGLLTSMYIINNWFVKYRGIATGILLMGSSIGPAIFAPLIGKWIKIHGWQTAALYEAIICSVLIIIPAILIVDHPAKKGTYADGIEGQMGGQPIINAAASKAHFKSAIGNYRFYLVLIVTAVLWFCIGGFIQNQRSYQADLKLDVEKSGLIQGLFFLCGLLGKLFFGWISDRIDVKKVMLLSVINMLAGAALLYASLSNQSFTIPAAIVFGLGYSGVFTMIQLYVLNLYGGPAYGKILGLLSFLDTLALSAGVIVLSSLRKTNGNYQQAFILMMVLCVVSLLATFIINQSAKTKA
jgi:MFS family permease